ncbi:uncharacterized protein [Salvelinus alpinus]|uniref:uncharacterized protein isoform X1 n=1 Tax=Salvelinus alpinus TaxID=8036 RepID=UPI0039FBBCB4
MTIWSKWRRSVVPNPISSICPRSIEGKSVLVSWRAALHSIPVYNLTNNLEVEGTKHIMEAYQRENRDIIQKNKAKLMREQEELLSLEELLLEDMLLEELLLLEEQGNEYRRLEDFQEEQRQLQAKRKSKQALLDKLDRAAQLETQIEKQKQVVKTTIFSTGIPMVSEPRAHCPAPGHGWRIQLRTCVSLSHPGCRYWTDPETQKYEDVNYHRIQITPLFYIVEGAMDSVLRSEVRSGCICCHFCMILFFY